MVISFPSWIPYSPSHPQYVPHPEPTQLVAPLVLVEGFMSTTTEFFWGDFETHLNTHREKRGSNRRRHIIFARVGPANSVHDRACELYYCLKGGTVDYGAEHAEENGHSRYGRHHKVGLYPSWSDEHPLHLLGHSLGGVTVTHMMALLKAGFFPGGHPDMVASVTTVASPFRGTPIKYHAAGSCECTGFAGFSFSSILAKYLHLVSYISPLIPTFLCPDLHNESRDLTFRDISFLEFLRQMWHSDWAEGNDAAPYDCGFEAAEKRDIEFDQFRRSEDGMGLSTWYRSYTCTFSQRLDMESPYHAAQPAHFLKSNPIMCNAANIVGSFDYTRISPLPLFFSNAVKRASKGKKKPPTHIRVDESWFENDGIVPIKSQWHPLECHSSYCMHHPLLTQTARPPDLPSPLPSPPISSSNTPTSSRHTSPTPSRSSSPTRLSPPRPLPLLRSLPAPGKWEVITVKDTHHMALMPLWTGSELQKTFWAGYGEFLELVDEGRGICDTHGASVL